MQWGLLARMLILDGWVLLAPAPKSLYPHSQLVSLKDSPPDSLYLKKPLSSQKDNDTREQNIRENCLSKIDK